MQSLTHISSMTIVRAELASTVINQTFICSGVDQNEESLEQGIGSLFSLFNFQLTFFLSFFLTFSSSVSLLLFTRSEIEELGEYFTR